MIRNGVDNNLRYNRFYFILDVKSFLKNCKYRLRLRFKRAKKRNILYLVFDPERSYPGLADRFKAIVALYNMAKFNGYDFKFYWRDPFPISEYLVPQGEFEAKLEDLEYSLLDTRFITEKNWADISTFAKDKQYHCYLIAGNELPKVFLNTELKWCNLFHELFKPSKKLEDAYHSFGEKQGNYISVHLRFVNALEKFENTYFNNYLENEEDRERLIEKCKRGIIQIVNENKGKDIYVFSDSKLFLNRLNDIPVKTLNSENIKHSGCSNDKKAAFKTFLDLLFMSRGEKIYKIEADELYKWSGFAHVASAIGDIPFETFKL